MCRVVKAGCVNLSNSYHSISIKYNDISFRVISMHLIKYIEYTDIL